jgi:putative ABC transport system substrate-binding protein
MNKRKLGSFVLCTMLFALCFSAEAQQPKKVPRIGLLLANSPSSANAARRIEAFRQGLRDLGYIEGQNLIIEYRYAEGKVDRLADLAAELVGLKVDAIFAQSTASVQAAKKATTTVPIVSVSGDPVGLGLVASLARPGGNVTGLTNFTSELAGKRLEFLKEAVSRVSRVAVLWNPDGLSSALRMRETEIAAPSLGIKLQPVAVREVNDFEHAFAALKKERADALFPLRSPLISNQVKRIVELAAKNRVPGMYDASEFPEAGGLMSYGTMLPDLDRRAAVYVDKILKGAKPAELPVEQPMKFELVINLKTAKQIGLTIPPEVLARATKLIK